MVSEEYQHFHFDIPENTLGKERPLLNRLGLTENQIDHKAIII